MLLKMFYFDFYFHSVSRRHHDSQDAEAAAEAAILD